MKTPSIRSLFWMMAIGILFAGMSPVLAETTDTFDEDEVEAPRTKKRSRSKEKQTRYFVEDQDRVDAGKFHFGFVAGGNFYLEPKVNAAGASTGEYFNLFGFQVGGVFDYDYIDTPLSLRGFVGYKYILESIHVFDFEGIARFLFPFSDKVNFGLGMGVSTAIWWRAESTNILLEEVIFLPSWVIHAGFDFNPFMVDFRALINRIGSDSSILGLELYFGVRL